MTDFNDYAQRYGHKNLGKYLCEQVEVFFKEKDSDTKVEEKKTTKTRADYNAEIEIADKDFDLLMAIVRAVNHSDLSQPEKASLLKKAAKGMDVPVAVLRSPMDASGDIGAVITELNAKHAVVPVAGRVYCMNEEFDPEMNRNLVTYSSASDFVMRYQNRKLNGSDIGSLWLEHPDRRQYDGVVFAPGKDIAGYFNLFHGFGVSPSEAGSCELFVTFLSEVICKGDSELFSYVWGWLAHLFQKPMELPGTSLVLRGNQGIGKNTFVDTIGALSNPAHYISLTNLDQVTGRFSGHLVDVLLVFANEAIWGGDKSSEGALKAIITDTLQAIEKKGKDIIPMRNYKRLIVGSNEDWVVPRGIDDRRFIIMDVSPDKKEDKVYFDAIWDELNAGGRERLMFELLNADISEFNPRKIPKRLREFGWELKIQSGGSVMQWWFEVLDNGYILENNECYADEPEYSWLEYMKVRDCHKLYLHWCERHKILHPEVDSVMGRKMKLWGIKKVRLRKFNRIPTYQFENLGECRKIFSDVCGIPMTIWSDSE